MKEKNEIINNTRKRLNMISGDFQNGNKFCDAIEEIIDYVEYCKEEKDKYKKELEKYNKDEEIAEKNKTIKYLRDHSLLQLSDKELFDEKAFRKEHYKKCKNPNRYQYEISGCNIGNCISIKCPICGEIKDITDIDSW